MSNLRPLDYVTLENDPFSWPWSYNCTILQLLQEMFQAFNALSFLLAIPYIYHMPYAKLYLIMKGKKTEQRYSLGFPCVQ